METSTAIILFTAQRKNKNNSIFFRAKIFTKKAKIQETQINNFLIYRSYYDK